MKKVFLFAFIAIVCFFKPVELSAVDMQVAIQLDNFGAMDDGKFNGYKPDFGFDVFVSGSFTDMVGASFMLQRTPRIGNMIKPRLIFETQNMGFQIGPSLGVLNKEHGGNRATAIQPGFGIGMNVSIDSGFFASFDIDFSLATGSTNRNIYLNNGLFEIGMRTQNAIVSLKVLQFTRTFQKDTTTTTSSLTDVGLFFEVFSKGSNFRFPFNCICKITDYQNSDDNTKNFTAYSIVLGAGVTHQIYHDMAWFCNVEASVVTFGHDAPNFYKVKAGCNFALN